MNTYAANKYEFHSINLLRLAHMLRYQRQLDRVAKPNQSLIPIILVKS